MKKKSHEVTASLEKLQNKIEALEKEIETKSQEYEKGQTETLKAKTESENYKKLLSEYAVRIRDTSTTNIKLQQECNKKIINNMIDVLKEIKILRDHIKKDSTIDSIKLAIDLLENKQSEYLKNRSVERKIVETGDSFDPYIHNAVSVQETQEKDLENKISHAFSDVFFLDGKCIHIADVIVFKYTS